LTRDFQPQGNAVGPTVLYNLKTMAEVEVLKFPAEIENIPLPMDSAEGFQDFAGVEGNSPVLDKKSDVPNSPTEAKSIGYCIVLNQKSFSVELVLKLLSNRLM